MKKPFEQTGVNSTRNEVDAGDSLARKKRVYAKPEIAIYGTLRDLTGTANLSGLTKDGGSYFGNTLYSPGSSG